MEKINILLIISTLILGCVSVGLGYKYSEALKDVRSKDIKIMDLEKKNRSLESLNEGLKSVRAKYTEPKNKKVVKPENKVVASLDKKDKEVVEVQQQQVQQQAAMQPNYGNGKTKKELIKQKQNIDSILARWDDSMRIAKTTARINLSPEIEKMQSIKREVLSAESDKCLANPKKRLTDSMSKFIEGMLGFKSSTDVGELLFIVYEKEYEEGLALYKHTSQQCVDMI